MTEQQPKTFNLTLTQIAAAALAAVTAAVLGSRLGVAGTVIGAAIASITTTTANAVYQHSLERSLRRSRERLAAATRLRPATPATSAVPPDATPTSTRIRSDAVEAEERRYASESTGASPDTRTGRRFAVAAGALAAFGLALVVVTGMEAMRGEPLSGGGGTTVGRVLGGATAPAQDGPDAPRSPSDTPAPASTSGPSVPPEPSVEPSEGPSETSVSPPPTTTGGTAPTAPPITTTSNGSTVPPSRSPISGPQPG